MEKIPRWRLNNTSTVLDETNFREFAEKVIKKYGDSGKLLDAMIWGQIVGYYEKVLANAIEAAQQKG